MIANWIARVKVPEKQEMWVGSFEANGRTDSKVKARRFVSAHLPLDTKIISIALGRIDVTFDGPEMPFEDATVDLHTQEQARKRKAGDVVATP